MNPSKVSAWHCLPMRRVSSMTCTLIATDQREARKCKEEKGRERQALPQECNVFVTEIVNVCIIQPHSCVVLFVIFQISERNVMIFKVSEKQQ